VVDYDYEDENEDEDENEEEGKIELPTSSFRDRQDACPTLEAELLSVFQRFA
jgi:hypothetical protein